jgi:hypothetical protein
MFPQADQQAASVLQLRRRARKNPDARIRPPVHRCNMPFDQQSGKQE